MYWPIGAPRIYAATNPAPSPDHVLDSDDDAGSRASLLAQQTRDLDLTSEVVVPSTHGPPAPDASAREGEGARERDDGTATDEPATDEPATDEPATDEPASRPSSSGTSTTIKDGAIIGLCVSRSGHLFATITASSLTIWQTRPRAVLATVVRSSLSLATYGPNVALLLRPDSAIFVVQASLGYLITYSLAADPQARVYNTRFPEGGQGHARHNSAGRLRGPHGVERNLGGPGEGGGVREVSVRFRMVIRLDAGVSQALALDDELVVATEKPAAVQCIRWTPDQTGNQTSTELLNRMGWLSKRTNVRDMVHDRPMNLSAWVTRDGKAYAVQRLGSPAAGAEAEASKKLFRGYCFHTPDAVETHAVKAAINAKFSLIAVACANGHIQVYSARDYVGNIPVSHHHRLSVSAATAGRITWLSYAPDGYCLFAGFERGWIMWSVYGQVQGSSFHADGALSRRHDEGWLEGVRCGSWLAGGCDLLLAGSNDERLWVLELARSAVTSCYATANIARSLLHTNDAFMVYRGHGLSDLTTISADAALWHHVQIPHRYLVHQWPLKSAVISADGRYVAVAGRRGLAHYSLHSGRWKGFEDARQENEFTIRGGMCWHRHILVAAVEAGDEAELRLYSRELTLDRGFVLHVEPLSSPVVHLAPSGDDSLLVYTYENVLYHYVITATRDAVKLVAVGQIGFHGIVRAPARVRAMSWILPDQQLVNGDPSQDVAVASVFFLVDGKLVLLQPSTTDQGELRYDMRVLAQKVEYYVAMREQSLFHPPADDAPHGAVAAAGAGDGPGPALSDSLWLFDGTGMRVWTDVQDITRPAPGGVTRELPPSIVIPLDFYPLSTLLDKGVILGVEAELMQRRDITFAFFRLALRTHLFLPSIFRHHLAQFDQSTALHLAHHYQALLYFSHALEVLLHDVLDEEVEHAPGPETALLPKVLSFLSSFPDYLDIVVQCTRKTEVRSWRTLFAYLPPPQDLFEESLQRGLLKTAGGYLLVLHTFQEVGSSSPQIVRLLSRARDDRDWDLCKELARFLMALDESGATLRRVLEL
ncbi:MAG: hypothetical protein M1838_000692, partial [Thelocarpon superellum]